MNMKIKVVAAFVLSASAMSVPCAMASTDEGVAGGTITFNGSVSDTTCDVTTNNGSDFTVNLSPVSTEDIGTTTGVISSGATEFTISVAGCEGYDASSSAAQDLDITFTGSNVSDDEQYLKNSSGTANGVGIAITNDGTTTVALDQAVSTGLSTTSSTDGSVFDQGAEGTITYYANYYNYGGETIEPGSVVTTATYTFSYE